MREVLYAAAALGGEALDFGGVERLGNLAGELLWRLLPSRRKLAVTAVARHLGLPPHVAADLARQSFRHTGRAFCETFLTRRADWRFHAERLRFATPDTARALQEDPEPAVLACAHLGSWELLAGVLHLSLPRPRKGIVVREGHDAALNQLLRRQRGRPGVEIVSHRGAAPKVLRILHKGGACAFLVDHNTRRDEAVFLPFLGETAAVNAGPAVLALRAKAAVWPVFLIREPQGRYALHVLEPLRTASLPGSQSERITAVAAFYTAAVERAVQRWPEQWFWMHKRWKTRPEP